MLSQPTQSPLARFSSLTSVPRTERSIINWCHANRQGITRLDCYYEENDRMYYITPISVERVIAEERNKLKIKAQNEYSEKSSPFSESPESRSESFGKDTNAFGKFPHTSEPEKSQDLEEHFKELEAKNRDLEINNRVKDKYIDLLENNQRNLIDQLTDKSHKIGALETKLRLLQPPEKGRAEEDLKEKPDTATVEAGEESADGEEGQKEPSGSELKDQDEPDDPTATIDEPNEYSNR